MSAAAASDDLVRAALRTVFAGADLSREATEELFGRLMDGTLSDVVKAALLGALAAKGESADEIAGAASAMRRRALRIEHDVAEVVDTCGTGGDGKGTFNISTAAALVAAAAGVPIAKHGNRSVSSRSGSADMLEALGVSIETVPANAAAQLAELSIAFLFAPRLHPAMAEVMPVRKELAVRTIFNVLGPLTNPAGARRQVMGVYAPELVETIGRVQAELGAEHALVVHGADGLDEITTTGVTHVAEVRRDDEGTARVALRTLEPEDLGVERAAPDALRGGTPADNAAAFERLIDGQAGPLLEITVANAGAAIYVGGRAPSLLDGVATARDAVASGAVRDLVERLRAAPEPS
ncbi:MAG: anthranilate phosphoribosyltransferase [Acidobacteriota bacterium]